MTTGNNNSGLRIAVFASLGVLAAFSILVVIWLSWPAAVIIKEWKYNPETGNFHYTRAVNGTRNVTVRIHRECIYEEGGAFYEVDERQARAQYEPGVRTVVRPLSKQMADCIQRPSSVLTITLTERLFGTFPMRPMPTFNVTHEEAIMRDSTCQIGCP